MSSLTSFAVNTGSTLQTGLHSITGSGSFTLAAGGTLGIGASGGISSSGATGNIQSTGVRSYNIAANYIYNGSATQITGNGLPAQVNQLTIGNSSGVTMTGGTAVDGTLFLTSGTLTTNANILIMNPTATRVRTTGHIIGSERRIFTAAGQSFIFDVGTVAGYSPATINVDSGTGNFTVSATDGALPGTVPQKTLQRFWSLASSGIAQADITFEYLQSDVPVSANESLFSFIRRTAGVNTSFAPSSFDVNTNIFTLNNQTTFSDWTLSDLTPPTAAAVSVSGRVLSADGRGIGNARITITDSAGNVRYAMTNPFGYYRFLNVSAGEAYIFNASHKWHEFNNVPRLISVNGEITNLDFVSP